MGAGLTRDDSQPVENYLFAPPKKAPPNPKMTHCVGYLAPKCVGVLNGLLVHLGVLLHGAAVGLGPEEIRRAVHV